MLWFLFALTATAEDDAVSAQSMVGHFEASTHAMLAVGTGELRDARRQARALAKQNGVPAPLKEAAQVLAGCHKIDCSGPAMANMGQTCAACHVETGKGPRVPRMTQLPGRNDRERHSFAALFMWIGLVTPQEGAWLVGVGGAVPPTATDETRRNVRPIEARFAQLVVAAEQTVDWYQRGDLFGEMLTLCAACHDASGLKND